MELNKGTFFFNMDTSSPGNTASWGKELGQGADKKFSEKYVDLLPGLLYTKVDDPENVVNAVGDGLKIVLASLFTKVFVNGLEIPDCKYILVVGEEKAGQNKGRRNLKFNPKTLYRGNNINAMCIEKIKEVLGISSNAAWFINEINIVDQDELHFQAYVANADSPIIYEDKDVRGQAFDLLVSNGKDNEYCRRKENFHRYLLSPGVFRDPDTGSKYWSILVSNRSEIQFVFDLMDTELDNKSRDLFTIADGPQASLLHERVKPDPRNKAFQSSVCSAILGKYVDFLKKYNGTNRKSIQAIKKNFDPCKTVQVIRYGAPGTGKSNGIKDKDHLVRVTFHPDSDYASFVGCYKPTMVDNGIERKIEYSFTKQPFLDLYIKAWTNRDTSFRLVIEEINRGNCAQIFGDFFQLLDRDFDGFSTYPIDVDNDMWTQINEALPSDYISFIELRYPKIDSGIQKMALPPNLSIYATMNTSDQSLFPMDSAFKRRWDWEYIKIDYNDPKPSSWYVYINDENLKWVDVLKKINDMILIEMRSADKQLGQWFVRPDIYANRTDEEATIISFKRFRDKVLFYLFNDVFKDNDDFGARFVKSNDKPFLFESLFERSEDEQKKIVAKFVKGLFPKSGNDSNNESDE